MSRPLFPPRSRRLRSLDQPGPFARWFAPSATLLAALGLIATACHDDSSAGLVRDIDTDDLASDVDSIPTGPTGTAGTAELGPDSVSETDDLTDATDDTGEAASCQADPGGLLCPCAANTDCDSGVCVPFRDGGKVCSRTCTEDCPLDWECRPIALDGGDPTFICVDRRLELCRPCRSHNDCQYPGFSEAGDRCVAIGEPPGTGGAFCATACDDTHGCPDGYTCRLMPSLGSAEQTRQCVPESGDCTCSGRAVELAAETDCHRDACSGTRSCEAGALTSCDAPTPSDEICDGLDNDCSGGTDEGFPDLDGDHQADCIDKDDDGDGEGDLGDNCPLVANPQQEDVDGDHLGDACDTPAMPVVLATAPPSPANDNHPVVSGTAEAGVTVTLYDDPNCTHALGPATRDAAAFGYTATVVDDTTTTFYARAANSALSSPCSNTSVTYVEDSKTPAAPTFVGTTPSSPSQAITNPIITGLAEGRATVRLYTNDTCTTAVAATTETGAQGVFLASVQVGEGTTTTFWATASDAAGNTSPCSSDSIRYTHIVGPIDTHITSGPSNPSTSTTATFWFIANVDEATFKCRVDQGAFTPCTSPADLTSLAQGPHQFDVAAINGNGVADPSPATFSWTIDTTPPQTTLTATPSEPSNDPTPTFAFTVNEAGTTSVCRIDGRPFTVCASPWTSPALADGAHTLYILSTDAAGNQEPVPASYTWHLDTDPPETTIDVLRALPNEATAVFNLKSDEPGTFRCTLDGATVACPAPGGSTWGATNLSDGSHSLSVAAVDAAGNVDATPATYTWTTDTAPPDTTFEGAMPAANSAETSVRFKFASNDPSATFECSLSGAQAFAPCSTPWTAVLGTGSYTFQVRAVDAAGNRDPTPASYAFRVDATAPDTFLTQAPPALWNQTTATFKFSSNAVDVVNYRCWIDSVLPVDCSSPHVESGLGQGTHTFEVAAVDSVGNEDASPATVTFTVDSVAPIAPTGLTATPGNRAVDLAWNAVTDAVSYRVSYGPAPAGANLPNTLDASGNSATVTPLANCQGYVFEVRAIDQAGNVSSASARVTATPVLPTPVVRVVGGQGSVTVRWQTVPNATGYRIYYSGTTGGPYTGTKALEGASPVSGDDSGTRALTGLPADDEVFVRFAAIDASGASVCESAQTAEWKSEPYPWDWVSPGPTGNTIRDVDCLGAACLAVGHVGTVLFSGDSGATWTRGNGDTGNDYRAVAWSSATHAIAIATVPTIQYQSPPPGSVVSTVYRTTDGGKVFVPILTSTYALDEVAFAPGGQAGHEVGWIVGDHGTILKTIDGGASWATQDAGTTGNLTALAVVSPTAVLIAGAGGTLLKTSDGGSWSEVGGPVLNRILDVSCSDATTCMGVGEGGTIIKTTGDWAHWTTVPAPASGDFQRVVLGDATHAAFVGTDCSYFVTADAGAHWSGLTPQNVRSDEDLFALGAVPAGGLLSGGEKGALHWLDATGTLTERRTFVTTATLRGAASPSANTLVVAGDQLILRSTNTGGNWSTVSNGDGVTLRGLVFGDSQTGYAVGDSGKVMKTTNGGAAWKVAPTGRTESFRAVSCIDANQCWTVTDNALAYKTTNGGTDWLLRSGAAAARAVLFTSATDGFIATDNSYEPTGGYTAMHYTHDGGTNWTSYHFYGNARALLVPPGGNPLYAGCGGSNYAVEEAGLTTYGGSTAGAIGELKDGSWQGVDNNTGFQIDGGGDCFFALTARKGGRAYAAGTQGLMARDLGTSGALGWTQLPAPTRERDLNAIVEVAPDVVFAFGEKGTILATDTGGL